MSSDNINDLIKELESLTRYMNVKEREKEKEIFMKLLSPKSWNFTLFEKVLVYSSLLDYYPFTTPETIHLSELRTFTDRLKEKTKKTKKEHARSCLADLINKKIIFGKTTRGDCSCCLINWDLPPGSHPLYMKRIMFMHTHPPDSYGIHLSTEDYITFLYNSDNIAMMMVCENTELLTLKTFQTPKRFDLENLNRNIGEIEKKYLSGFSKLIDLINFTKAVCAYNYLSLYIIKSGNGDLAEKINF